MQKNKETTTVTTEGILFASGGSRCTALPAFALAIELLQYSGTYR